MTRAKHPAWCRCASCVPHPALPASSAPIVMSGDGGMVALGDHAFRVYLLRGRPCVVAFDLGRALGYADDGKQLAQSIRDNWSAEFEAPGDVAVLTGAELREFKLAAGDTRGSRVSTSSRLMVLFESGMDLACQKAQTPAGERLRRYLADEVLPKLRRGLPPTPAASVALPPSEPSPDVLELKALVRELVATVETMVARGAPAASVLPPADHDRVRRALGVARGSGAVATFYEVRDGGLVPNPIALRDDGHRAGAA